MQQQKTVQPNPQTINPGAMISVIVPFFNERETVVPLAKTLISVLEKMSRPFEIIFVDDGSDDDGPEKIHRFSQSEDRIRVIIFTQNFGKAAALSAGIQRAVGSVIITMDADLQDEPNEIPRFLEKMEEGFDVVSGWKEIRHDTIGKRIPSKVFNTIVRWAFQIDLHDINCGFKAYDRRAAKSLNLYGELHRFTPALLQAVGYSVGELSVQHHPRAYGHSKYGASRFIKGLLDLITVKLMTRYHARPLHFFGMLGVPIGLLGALILGYLTILWFAGLGPIGDRPLLLIGILFLVTSTQLLGIGLIAELLQTSRLAEHDKYVIKMEIGFEESSDSSNRQDQA